MNSSKNSIFDRFYVVHGWMIEALGLEKQDLLVFSVIYGFCVNNREDRMDDGFYASREHLSRLTTFSIRTVADSLKNLLDKKYIYVVEKVLGSTVIYNVNMQYVSFLKNKYENSLIDNIIHENESCAPLAQGCAPLARGGEQFAHNIKNINKAKEISTIEKENSQPSEDKQMIQNELFPAEVFSSENISVETTKTKKSSTKSVKKSDFPPTVEEIDAYLREKDLPLDAFKIWQWYDTTNWCDKSGRKISNWKIKILNSWMSPKYHPELANKHYNDVGHTKPEVDAPKNEVSLPTAEENDASSKQVHEISEAGKRIQAMLRASLKNNS